MARRKKPQTGKDGADQTPNAAGTASPDVTLTAPEHDPRDATAPGEARLPADDLAASEQADTIGADDAAPAASDPQDGSPEAAQDAEAVVAQPDTAEPDTAEPQPATGAPADDTPAPQPAATTAAPAPVILRKGGTIPMVLGGVVAAGLGFFAARYDVLPPDWPIPQPPRGDAAQLAELDAGLAGQSDRIDTAQAQIDALRETIAALPDAAPEPGVDPEALAALATRLDDLGGALADLDTRLAALEARPASAGGTGATGDVSAEFAALRAELAAQQDRIKALDDAAETYDAQIKALSEAAETYDAQIKALSDEAEAQDRAAAREAREALARAALNRAQTALDSGAGFEDALADLAGIGIDVPEALTQAGGGVATLAALREEFPPLARAALATARRDAPDTAGGGIASVLRNQLNVRSLEPREGDDPDAVLSRAEAAVRDGDLATATAEIGALPEAARDILSEWTTRATQRQAALDAVATLGQNLTAN